MNAQSISRDVALRIGLAARVLPGVDARQLLEVLKERLGFPLTEDRLTKMTVTDLKTGLASLDGEEDSEDTGINMEYLKLAVRFLWGEEGIEPDLPEIQAYQDGDMPGSIRVAIGSNGADDIDGHYGSCPRFLVYQVSPEEIRLVDIRSTVGADQAEDKNAFRAELIGDCHVMYVQSIGGPAAAKVVRAGIYPMKLPEGGKAPEVLAKLQTVMRGTPPPWLAKIIGIPAEKRTKFTAEA
ncbi:MAG: dinitrogenase iron-molybdenum cofactor biosynthesis protein [Gammaproteobacteria bacterium SG8_11]|nr:MAG: dinitrogenase iron-molybdenum cofactor biosynthesis protein [Gammaproteobacteria bacterium SG8_11]